MESLSAAAAVSSASAVPASTKDSTDVDTVALEYAVQKAISMKEICWNRSKVMLVGQGRAGKSSLARLIMGYDFNLESPSTCGMDKFEVNVTTGFVESTHDISSRCQWQEYKEEGSHLNNALASMAHIIAKQTDKMLSLVCIVLILKVYCCTGKRNKGRGSWTQVLPSIALRLHWAILAVFRAQQTSLSMILKCTRRHTIYRA